MPSIKQQEDPNQPVIAVADQPPSTPTDEIDAQLQNLLGSADIVKDVALDLPDNVTQSIAGLASQGRDRLLDTLRDHRLRQQHEAEAYKPPPMTERQMSQTQLEMEAGRAAQQRHQEMQDAAPARPRDKSEGYSTPVHRPNNFVPGINSRDPARK